LYLIQKIRKEVLNFEKTAIVGIVTQNQSEEKLKEYLDELEFLTLRQVDK
jgi:GTP-binding protein HflX